MNTAIERLVENDPCDENGDVNYKQLIITRALGANYKARAIS